MEKRLPLFLIVCFLWIMLFQHFFTPPREENPSPTGPGGNAATGEARPESSDTVDPGAGGGTGTADKTGAGKAKRASDGSVAAVDGVFDHTEGLAPAEIVIETSEYLVCLSNQGAVLSEIRFRHYFNEPDVLHDDERRAQEENWLDILHEVQDGTPSFVLRETAKARYFLDEECWEHKIEKTDSGGQAVVFTYHTADGWVFRKVFTFYNEANHLDVRVEVENRDPAQVGKSLRLTFEGPCGIIDRKRASFTDGPMGVLDIYSGDGDMRNRELTTIPAGDLTDLKDSGYTWTRRGGDQLLFAGVANNYFAMLLKPTEGKFFKQVRFFPLEDSRKTEEGVREFEKSRGVSPAGRALAEIKEKALTNVRLDFELRFDAPEPGKSLRQAFLFFVGPKSTELMERPEYAEFYQLIEDSYGSMAWINKLLIWILNFFHTLFGNWGAAIIGLTIVVKIVLFPLNRVQQTSMASYSEKMKKLKPKLDALKKKFKNNKKKFNEAQMKLMKEEGIRPPLMGCMLIFFQFPIFIGLFQILRTSFELRHSPFCLWIQDLSQPDALPLPFTLPLLGNTLNVVPILMTVAFYYQQKMMPKPDTSDPQAAQMQKIMKFMPIIFGVMFYGYASGLSLYWMTSNLISILEYRFIRKKFPVGGRTVAQAKPA